MSGHERDGVVSCLFSGQDKTLLNMKFFRGDRDVISEAEFRAEVCSIEQQKKLSVAKRSSHAPRSEREPIDVRDFVATI